MKRQSIMRQFPFSCRQQAIKVPSWGLVGGVEGAVSPPCSNYHGTMEASTKEIMRYGHKQAPILQKNPDPASQLYHLGRSPHNAAVSPKP